MKALNRSKHPLELHSQITRILRDRIVAGTLQPGGRLPTRIELASAFHTTTVTVQKSLDHLRHDGFVITRGRAGTFVVSHPPHLTRYALVFPSSPFGRGWTRFWHTICGSAQALEATEQITFPLFYDVDGHSDVEAYQTLVADARSSRLAGIIFAGDPFWMKDVPGHSLGVPAVTIQGDYLENIMPLYTTDRYSFLDRALDYLRGRGRRKIAVLHTFPVDSPSGVPAVLAERLARRGLEVRRLWSIPLPPGATPTAAYITEMLMALPREDQPDALVITDDHWVEFATRGLLAAGKSVPRDFDVVAHTNFPDLPQANVPVRWLGFDTTRLLRGCIEILQRQQQGETVPPITFIPPVFADELPGSNHTEQPSRSKRLR